MKKKSVIVIFLFFYFILPAQKKMINDSLNIGSSDRLINGFLTLITDVTINEHKHFVMTGIGGAFLLKDKFFIGAYGIGLISSIHQSVNAIDYQLIDCQLNYAHGGLWFGIKDVPCRKFQKTFNLKIGWGAVFLYNINNSINYNTARDEFLVITPQIETSYALTNWLRINIGLGVRFISGLSKQYIDRNGKRTDMYKSSDFEGFNTTITLSIGSFCRKTVR
ncbi:MAG: hypothetical protein ACOYO1_02845 [Bacteroidales bacterium]